MEREASESGRWEGGIDPKMSTAIVNYGECYLETRRDTLAHLPTMPLAFAASDVKS